MMRLKLLGRSGLRVSELALGTMTFGEDWGWGAAPAECAKILTAFGAAGGNFIDTACNYTEGSSERIIGELIAGERDYWVVATKYTLRPNGANRNDANLGGNSRKALVRSVEASLKRLNTDYIDVLYLHMWDFTTPIEEVMRGMDDLVRAGKVLYPAFSDTPAWVIAYAVALVETRGWSRPVAVQLPYSVRSRDGERDILPLAHALDLGVTTWGMLDGGILTGKYYNGSDAPRRYDGAPERLRPFVETLAAVASEVGGTPAQVAINWVRQRSPQIIPIVGARTAAQLTENLRVLDFELPPSAVQTLGAAANFRPGFPLDFLTSADVRDLIFADTFERLDNHRAQTA